MDSRVQQTFHEHHDIGCVPAPTSILRDRDLCGTENLPHRYRHDIRIVRRDRLRIILDLLVKRIRSAQSVGIVEDES